MSPCRRIAAFAGAILDPSALTFVVRAVVVVGLISGAAAAAGNAAAGRQKALICQACHDLDGKSKIPEAPNLAGQSEPYLVKALKDYRSGARNNDMMSLVVPGLTDKDIEDLAAYFSAIEVSVTPASK